MTIEKTSENIVNDIIDDLSDRCGIGDEWEQIDSDIQEEIKESWREIVELYIK